MEYYIDHIKNHTQNSLNNFKVSKQKEQRIKKLKKKLTRNQSILGEILLKKLLKEKYNLDYNQIEFYENNYGKPYLKNQNIYFNISHSYNYVITIISKKEIGIDIEKIRKTPLNVINQFATPQEKLYILSSKKNIHKRIFQIYTLKEAYFKMQGTNLNNILDITFLIKNNKVYCNDNSVKVGFLNEKKGYIIAYCEKR